jgi:hypothetical protein
MTHKYERISKLITENLGEPYSFVNDHYIIPHCDLVHFAYAVLEEFDKPQSIKIIDDGYEW